MAELLIDRPTEHSKYQRNSQIKYCSVQPWSGIIPRKHETTASENQIIFADEIEDREIRLKSHIHTDGDGQEPTLLNSTRLIDLLRAEFSKHGDIGLWIDLLNAWRDGIKTVYRKGGYYKRSLNMLYLWGIERKTGFFSRTDIYQAYGWNNVESEGRERMIKDLIERDYIIEIDWKRQKKNDAHRYMLSSRYRSLLLRTYGHALSLGDQIRANDTGSYLSAEMIRGIRLEAQLTQKGFGAVLGISEDQVSEWERGVRTPSKSNLKKIYKNFYFLVAPCYWPEQIKQDVRAKKLPRYGADSLASKRDPKAITKIKRDAWTIIKPKIEAYHKQQAEMDKAKNDIKQ